MDFDSPTSLVVLSPHYDDAALSLGLTLLQAAREEVAIHIVNVYTLSAYAPHAEAEGVVAVSLLRAQEDESFAAWLPGAMTDDLGRRDSPLRGYSGFRFVHQRPFDADERTEVLDLALQLRAWGGHDRYYVPLALGSHIDHRIARVAAERAWAGADLCYYEDMPYGAVDLSGSGASREAALAKALTSLGDEPEAHLGGAKMSPADKRPLIASYGSQLSREHQEAVVSHAQAHGGERWWRRAAASASTPAARR